MSTAVLVDAIKRRLRAQGITYLALARRLGLSEPTVKRDLARGDFSLKRLDRICDVLGVTLTELANEPSGAEERVTKLTDSQERALTAEPRLLLITYLLVNRWSLDEITRAIEVTENELIKAVLALDAIGIVRFRPPRGVQLRTARNFSWRKDGPVHGFFLKRVAPDYFASRFDGAGDDFNFVAGSLSAASQTRLKAALNNLTIEFEELARQDARLPVSQRHGCAAILAMRDWRFSEFARYRKTRK